MTPSAPSPLLLGAYPCLKIKEILLIYKKPIYKVGMNIKTLLGNENEILLAGIALLLLPRFDCVVGTLYFQLVCGHAKPSLQSN